MKARRVNGTSIHRQLLLTLFLPAAVVLVAGTVSDYLTALSPLTAAYDQALLDSALVIAANVRKQPRRPSGLDFAFGCAGCGSCRLA